MWQVWAIAALVLVSGFYFSDSIVPAYSATCQSIENPSPSNGDYFGGTIAANNDVIVVSAIYDDTGAIQAGIVYVFDANNCKLLQTITNPEPDDLDSFGFSLAIVESDKLAVGTHLDDSLGNNAGKVYVFDINSGNMLFTITSPNPNPDDMFGMSVASYGTDILVGSPGEDAVSTWTNIGGGYLFDGTNGSWIGSFGSPSPQDNVFLGTSIGEFGNKVVVGAPQYSTEGIVYIYDFIGNTGLVSLTSPTPENGDQFGAAFGTIDDLIVVGEPTDRTIDGGTAYSYDGSGKIIANLQNPEPGFGHFGGSSIVGYDPECVAIGDFNDDRGSSTTNQGTVFIFNARTGDYITKIQPQATNPSFPFLHTGKSIAINDSNILIGVPRDYVSSGEDGRVILHPLIPCVNEEGSGGGGSGGGSTAQYVDLQWDPTSFVLADSNLNPINVAELGKQFHVIMDIKNTGNIPASPFDFLVQLWDTSNNKSKYHQHHTYNNILAAGQTDTITIPITMQITGSFGGSFSADSKSVISELDEYNNREFFSMDITPPQTIPLPSISLNQHQYLENDSAFVNVIDGTKSGSVTVDAYGSLTQNHFTLTLVETGIGTAIFSETINRVGDIAVSGEKLIVEYGAQMTSADVVPLPPPDIAFDKSDYDPSETVTVNAISHYDNIANQFDTISVRIHSLSNPTGMTVSLQESGINTAIFSGKFSIPSWAANDGSMTATFTDSAGNTVSTTATITQNRQVSIDLDKSSYLIGDSAKVTIIDDAANQIPTLAERITYNVWSSTNLTPMIFDAIETDIDSGEFVQYWPVSGIAQSGDTITVEYKGVQDSANVISTQPILPVTITSLQATDPQGNLVSQYNKGTIAYAKVSVSVSSSTDALVAIMLFDSNNTPLSLGTVQTTLQPGNNEFVMSLSVPSNASVGTGVLYANVLSDWPQNGGVLLTTELQTTVIIN